MAKKLTSRSEDYSKWYNELVVMADLAENAAVRGCIVVSLWTCHMGKNASRVG